MLTTHRRLGPGAVQRTGSLAAYRSVQHIEGEPHMVRAELIGDQPGSLDRRPGDAPIACLAHLTDLHVTDVQSPARFEFVNKYWQDPRFRELLTMQRPHEALTPRAVDAMVQTLNQIRRAPQTDSPLQLLLMTGDGVDNAQRNELDNVLALLDGGTVKLDSGIPWYEGVQRPDWPGDFYWKPDGPPEGDTFQSERGFPRMPGLLDRAMERFVARGLRVPWLGGYGNHEELCQGVGLLTPELARVMAGSKKAYALPEAIDPDTAVETFVSSPEVFTTGPAREVSPDGRRRPIDRREFVDVMAAAGGHGFVDRNRQDGVAYYVHDTPEVRFITLETVCQAGGAEGHVDARQLAWLEERLREVHSRHLDGDGSEVRTSNADRLVVVASHHGSGSLSNPRAEASAGRLMAILARFPNIVLWLNGHIHANRISPRPNPTGGFGFWEVTTSSIVDWPCQARLVEIFPIAGRRLAIACTMVDHEGSELGDLHRELAANVPARGFGSWYEGSPTDRNAILLLPRPF